ncbi:MAG TPA: ABC transporter ATP-binding protein [Tepidisphaeraceae bacterium]|jgi:energy-coupling factor transporter ATP-binding protein EcfA2|nr:ABC transporter ATP-binding protein [Tepidisphaeraceae bacterium]
MNFSGAAAVEVRDLCYQYPEGTSALGGMSFSIAPGECVGIIGPNGAGKSTLLLHLNGVLPFSGDDRITQNRPENVFIHGEPIRADNLPSIRRQVGLLFQDPDDQLFCSTVHEDVAFGPQQFGVPKDQHAGIVTGALLNVGLWGYESRSPHRLSGGEKRRVCMAGVLACDPTVLVLDEPTSNLDPRGRREVKSFLQRLPATKLIATHDLELVVELCPRVIVIDQGRVVADGDTLQLLGDEELMLRHGLEKPHILMHHHPHR